MSPDPKKIKHWLSDNLLEMIIITMFTAFFVNYQADRINTKAFREDMISAWQEQERQITVLYFTLLADPTLTETQKTILKDFMRSRGAKVKSDIP